MSIIAWGACNTLGDVLEDSEARESTFLRRRIFYAVVFLSVAIHKSAYNCRSGLEADDISDLVSWLGDQILFLTWQTFISFLIFLFWIWREKTVANLTWLYFSYRHLKIAFLAIIWTVDLISEHDI